MINQAAIGYAMMAAKAQRLSDIEIKALCQAMHDIMHFVNERVATEAYGELELQPYNDDYDGSQMALDADVYAFWLNDMDEEYERKYRAEFDAVKSRK
ncbi:hypothetical protein SD71_11280 [Cohnella kolymensis]|uniref:Uncharacterized protein n=1 Tax=Cohnella kolymensis TaxID=1590652 RepID=A0ABR5A4H1_9BACL|nr:hypothetical protein [Cohnella kolymensis]KIL35942.1 hypothetical protein SD71_11280 [Cohnella kolymensis]